MRNKNILLMGVSFNSDNRGVNALGIGALTFLKKKYDSEVINVIRLGALRGNCEEVVKTLNGEVLVRIHNFNISDVIKMWLFGKNNHLNKVLNEANLAFNVNEGDSFSDIYGGKRLLKQFIESYIILRRNISLTFLPQTIGPFNTWYGRYIGKWVLPKLEKLYIRGEEAINYLNDLGVEYELKIDMAVLMQPEPVSFVMESNKKYLGLNVNGFIYHNSYSSLKGQYGVYKDLICAIIRYYSDKDWNVLLIPNTYNFDNPNPEDDLEAIKDLMGIFNTGKDNVSYLNLDLTAQEVKYIIGQMDCFLGSRMHACIAALSQNIPTVGLAYSYKFFGTFRMFDKEDSVIELTKLDGGNLKEVLTQIDAKLSKCHSSSFVKDYTKNYD